MKNIHFLGKKFKEYRKKANLTQEELSEKIEIAEKHYGKLERGVFMPSLETFFKLIDTLKIPLSEFGIQIEKIENTNRDRIIKEIENYNTIYIYTKEELTQSQIELASAQIWVDDENKMPVKYLTGSV